WMVCANPSLKVDITEQRARPFVTSPHRDPLGQITIPGNHELIRFASDFFNNLLEHVGSDRIKTEALGSCFDAFSSREPVSTSLENALVRRSRQIFPTGKCAHWMKSPHFSIVAALPHGIIATEDVEFFGEPSISLSE